MLQNLLPEGSKDGVMGADGVFDDVTGSAETASVHDILDRWKKCPNDLLSSPHHSLQRFLHWGPVAAKPDGDITITTRKSQTKL